jgi:hypothetical protein
LLRQDLSSRFPWRRSFLRIQPLAPIMVRAPGMVVAAMVEDTLAEAAMLEEATDGVATATTATIAVTDPGPTSTTVRGLGATAILAVPGPVLGTGNWLSFVWFSAYALSRARIDWIPN